ncbi:MAG TPA: hypothetical protein VFI29_11240 [Hanamia sp.]|nr:hypothetical protein [Hanamia sp.]
MKKIITFAATLFLLSCNNNGNKPAKTSGNGDSNPTSNPATNDAPGSGAAGTEINVTLTGGPNAGTYTATSADPTCSEGLTGDNSFGNQYSEKGKADNELSSLQLIIDDKDAAKKGTDKFYLKVAFGKILKGKSYEINGGTSFLEMPLTGSGKATLMESGSIKTVVVEGKTADGVGISATIKCNSMITAG